MAKIERTVKDLGVWSPLPGPQTETVNTKAFEVLYGGQAGGAKSNLLLGVARTRHLRSLLLRRTYPDLQRSLIPDSIKFYGDPKYYNGSLHLWRVEGRKIEFGNLENPKDVYNYQGAQYDFLGVDELTQFSKNEYLYLFSRVRSTVDGQRCRVIAATNPGGEGEGWVMERWAPWLDEADPRYPTAPGILRWFKTDADGADVETTADDPDGLSRTFIPAKLKDNPYLGADYRRTLMALPEPFRSQLMNGDWKAGSREDTYQVFPRAWVAAAFARWKPDGFPTEKGKDGKIVRSPCDEAGFDISRGGQDKTVLAPRFGTWFAPLIKRAGRDVQDGPAAAAMIADFQKDHGGVANVDVIGIGAAAYDCAVERGLEVRAINVSEASDGRDRSGKLKFLNKKAEYTWRLREALDPETGEDLAFPPDPELRADLLAYRWELKASGLKIESKDEMKKRIGRSPDCGDAVILARTMPCGGADTLAGIMLGGMERESLRRRR